MPNPSLLYIDLELGRSAIWCRLALSLHLVGGVLPFFSAAGFFSFLLWPVLIWSFVRLLRRDYYRNSTLSVYRVRCYQGEWKLQTTGSHANSWRIVELMGEQLITPFLTVLKFKHDSISGSGFLKTRYLRVVIFRDAVHPESFRQLRVHLRMASSP